MSLYINKLIILFMLSFSTLVFAGSPPTPTTIRVDVVKKNKHVAKRLRRANMYSRAKEKGNELVINKFGLDLFFDDGEPQSTLYFYIPHNHIERIVDEICVSKGYHYNKEPKKFLGMIGSSETIVPRWQPTPKGNQRVAIMVYAEDVKAIVTHWWSRDQFIQTFGSHTRFHILSKVTCKMYPAKWEPHSYYADPVKGLEYKDIEHLIENHDTDYGSSTVITDVDDNSSIEPPTTSKDIDYQQPLSAIDMPMMSSDDGSGVMSFGAELPAPQPLGQEMQMFEDEKILRPGHFINKR